MKEVRKIAKAKINLALDVIGKRDNGYHDVRMIMQTIELHDKLRLKKLSTKKIIMETNLSYLPTDERNLVVKIVKYFMDTYDLKYGVFIDLYKVIPVGAGLAGGSTNAAQTILGMNELFELNLSLEEMLAIGKRFGADIPYCIGGGTALAEGIGEELTPLSNMPKLFLVVAKPKVSVSTAYVYENLKLEEIAIHPNIGDMINAIAAKDVPKIASCLGNVLEEVTMIGYPEVKIIKSLLMAEGALGALMSGSGSAVFGIFADKASARRAASKLKNNGLIKNVFETTTSQ